MEIAKRQNNRNHPNQKYCNIMKKKKKCIENKHTQKNLKNTTIRDQAY